jgi:hypothetical protein
VIPGAGRPATARRAASGWMHGTLPRAFAPALVLAPLLLPGCMRFGPQVLGSDHLDYAKALSNAQKRETLFNVVRLRYGDTPVFLSTSQVIAGYSLGGTAEAGVNTFPGARNSSFFTALGTVDYANHPTFTFTPITGKQFAQSYIQPLSPAQLLPLAQSGLPVDVLLRLGVQAIGELQNSNPSSGPARAGSPDFFRLIADLRTLQLGNALSLRLQRAASAPKEEGRIRVFFLIAERNDPDLRRIADETLRLLGLDRGTREFEVVYGRGQAGRNRVAVLTRSILAMLIEVGSQVEVPEQDVLAGRTLATVRPPAPGMLPEIKVRSGPDRPPASFVSLNYRGRWFWVDDEDFRSKAAFSVLELLHSIAESGQAPQTPLVTIPVG